MKLDFDKYNGLIPAVIQDARTHVVLMVGFMNKEAYQKTVEERLVTFYSRTRKRLWTKGEESGNFLDVIDIKEDCDNDTVLIKAIPRGPVCHTGADTCFFETNAATADFLTYLQDLIDSRKKDLPEGSYTTKLFEAGINKIAQKVGEEAVELVIEAKDNEDTLFLNEAADLLFHLLVLLSAKNYRIEDVVKVLEKRHKK
ncbi:MAG TPA: bifunctional phosphoribosyl-AMP cyclohydrolase/phosphoribosyl-ATP diphosphatase HisIE [Bacteroidales bacterium]|nr:bifunctional phosphoribosyl-AMP cyclohydrolase/phosphoribosyl-ATP diphosphatase HisIE [Bacteroidales bacterium]HPO65278.1 bifunctional phosphoribosyl-AMP cyclohydrolase/phosphoribosyl-ATP diphosphatase HisIE [Bacteroidales bacterium]